MIFFSGADREALREAILWHHGDARAPHLSHRKNKSMPKTVHPENHAKNWPWVKIQNPVPPVNIPISTKIDYGWCTYPTMGSQNGFDNHSQLQNPASFLCDSPILQFPELFVLTRLQHEALGGRHNVPQGRSHHVLRTETDVKFEPQTLTQKIIGSLEVWRFGGDGWFPI